jgi:NTE family protein
VKESFVVLDRYDRWLFIGVLLCIAAMAGCATVEVPVATTDEPQAGPALRPYASRPVVALVLSGGSARGFAHIGVIKVLEEAGIEPDLVVGTSAGSIVAVAYASGMSAQQMADAASTMTGSLFMDLTIPNLGQPVIRGELGWIRGTRLQRFVERLVDKRPLESLRRRVAIVATQLESGMPVAFTQGDTGLAVRASVSVPGVFVPPLIGGKRYVDGQISSPVPVALARSLGADVVIAVDATFPPDHAEIANTASVLFQAMTIATQRIKHQELALASIVITPDIRSSSQLGLSDREWIMQAGERAASQALPRLRALVPDLRSRDRATSILSVTP